MVCLEKLSGFGMSNKILIPDFNESLTTKHQPLGHIISNSKTVSKEQMLWATNYTYNTSFRITSELITESSEYSIDYAKLIETNATRSINYFLYKNLFDKLIDLRTDLRYTASIRDHVLQIDSLYTCLENLNKLLNQLDKEMNNDKSCNHL